MINDSFGVQGGMEPEQYFDEAPNEEARRFYDQLEESSRPLCEGSPHSSFLVAVRLMNIKSDWNVPNAAMDSMVDLLGELVNPEFIIPKNFYQAKRMISRLGLTYDRIHGCVNGCMLFYKTDSELENCKLCGHARYKRTQAGKMVLVKEIHYLLLIPRLKRLYASVRSAPHKRWHREYRRMPGVLSHPSDGQPWKHFDNIYILILLVNQKMLDWGCVQMASHHSLMLLRLIHAGWNKPTDKKCSTYDLVSVVKRQSPFFYQVSRPHMTSEVYLDGAVARYKGFLHLIRRNKERSIDSFSVPTYDIDLIWHTHQLHPISYCKDLVDIMGKVLNHDDTDSD
ncbi:hypothetical protein MTR67_026503 [Solanum verrucosum]|uniref:Uncharacterized protein n=1 Tax=Solanum verrucosum TaxID=315347 RepID=A0AAF0R1U1_SOLVR|nr:hypothetical protein MTR67_026503 [Solanum verrucosum]